jgi:hypothetical protein
LDAVGCSFGVVGCSLGAPWALLGSSWAILGSSWALLGTYKSVATRSQRPVPEEKGGERKVGRKIKREIQNKDLYKTAKA